MPHILRNPRRAYDADGNEIRPMSLGNMREHGVRSVLATCQETSCRHAGSINVDNMSADVPVPDVALRLRCSACGSRTVKTQPDWIAGRWDRAQAGDRRGSLQGRLTLSRFRAPRAHALLLRL